MNSSKPEVQGEKGAVFALPRRYWYLDLVVVAGMVLLAYAIIFFL